MYLSNHNLYINIDWAKLAPGGFMEEKLKSIVVSVVSTASTVSVSIQCILSDISVHVGHG